MVFWAWIDLGEGVPSAHHEETTGLTKISSRLRDASCVAVSNIGASDTKLYF